MAEANYEFLITDLATKESVHNENEKIRREIIEAEKRMTMTMGKLTAFAIGVILAGAPIIQALLNKLG